MASNVQCKGTWQYVLLDIDILQLRPLVENTVIQNQTSNVLQGYMIRPRTKNDVMSESVGNLSIAEDHHILLELRLSQGLPILPLNWDHLNKEPGSILEWSNWIIRLFDIVLLAPAKCAKTWVSNDKKNWCCPKIPLELGREKVDIREIIYDLKLDLSEKEWNKLLNAWLKQWPIKSHWNVASYYMQKAIRIGKSQNIDVEDYLLSTLKGLESRWNAEHGHNPNVQIRDIYENLLDKIDLNNYVPKKLSTNKGFHVCNIAKVVTKLRHEFTHPASKNRRNNLRVFIRNPEVYRSLSSLSWLILNCTRSIMRDEVFKKCDTFSDDKNPLSTGIQNYRIDGLVKGWDKLLNICK